MIALTSTVAPTLAGQAFAAVKVAVAHVGRRLADAWSHRHDAATLAALDDRMLADIGLHCSTLLRLGGRDAPARHRQTRTRA